MAVRCPKCANVFTPAAGQPMKCPKCGFSGGGSPNRPATGAPAAASPYAASPYAAPPPAYGGHPMQGGPLPKGQAVTAMVLGIVSCCIWIIPIAGLFIALACAIVAVVLAVMAMKKAKLGQAAGKGMAITGLVLGIITLALSLTLIIISFFAASILEELCKDQASNPACKDYQPKPAIGDAGTSGVDGLRVSAILWFAALPVPGAARLALKLA